MSLAVIGTEFISDKTFSQYGLDLGAPGKLVCFIKCKFNGCTGTVTGTVIEFNDCSFINTTFEFITKSEVNFNGCDGTLSLSIDKKE
jgi:hypothetical protein